MFTIAQQGLVGVHGLSSKMMYGMSAEDDHRCTITAEDDEDLLSEIMTDADDADEKSLLDIPFEQQGDDDDLDQNSWHNSHAHNSSHAELYPDHDGDDNDDDDDHEILDPSSIPFEQHVAKSSWNSVKNKPRQPKFHIESLAEIPFEDARKAHKYANSNGGIPYEQDTVTTVTEEMSSFADSVTVDDMEEEDRDDCVASLLDGFGIIEEEEVADDYDPLDSLLEETTQCEDTPEVVSDNDTQTFTSVSGPVQMKDAEMQTEETFDDESDEAVDFDLQGFLVDVELRPTPYLGRNQYGVFAAQDIPRGVLLWEFSDYLQTMHHSELEAHIEHNFEQDDVEGIREFLRRGLPLQLTNTQHFVSAMEGLGYLNHSAAPNVCAKRSCHNIRKGEELTIDYASFGNPQWYTEICHKYGIMSAAEIAVRQEKLGSERFLPADYTGDEEELVFA